MSQSIRISDELIEEAKRHAKLYHRSPPQQIEHWAAVGRVMEVALAYPAQEKVAQAVTGKQLDEALALVGTEKGRERAWEIINKPKNHEVEVKPLLVMLAGPNGAGKSTFYEAYLSELGLPFLNADALAKTLGMGAYEAAHQIAEIRRVLVNRRTGFVTESVLSDPVGEKVEFLRLAAKNGFDVRLIYIGITNVEMSIERVRTRVLAGGHDVPLEKLKAQYERTLTNLERAVSLLPRVTIYDNSSYDEPYRLIAEFIAGKLRQKTVGQIPNWSKNLCIAP